MSFLLHLDTIMAVVQGNQQAGNRMLQNQGSLHISVCTITGMELWLVHPMTPLRFMQTYMSLVRYIPVLDLDEPIAHRAASIGGRLAARGKPMETMDLFVAATAIVHKLPLVTSDTQSFSGVPGLTLLDWLVP
jgi:tRNA(fMet)-specific endonuclease VapC